MGSDRFFSGAAIAILATVLMHAGLGLGLGKLDNSMVAMRFPAPFRWEKPAKVTRRAVHGSVACERRQIDEDCRSQPECHRDVDPVLVVLELAKLGTVEPKPKALPELQTLERPETIEAAVNLDTEPVAAKPLPLQDFLKKKAELDRRVKERRRRVDNLFEVEDDPRATPTVFEKLVGRTYGDVYGKNADQASFDTYFGRCALELHKQFHVPTAMGRAEIQKQRVDVLITKLSDSGEILAYRIRNPASNRSFTLAAEAAIRAFAPSEGGRQRLPEPDADILDFVNTQGLLIALDGRLFQ